MSKRNRQHGGRKPPDSSARDVQAYGVRNAIRQEGKNRMFGAMYGTSTKRFASNTLQTKFVATREQAQKLRDAWRAGKQGRQMPDWKWWANEGNVAHPEKQMDFYERYIQEMEAKMKQTWIINDEWSEYHQACAKQDGWALSHVGGMWEIASTDESKFPTNDQARAHVLAHETDPDNALYMLAVNAIIMGNMGKS